MVKSGQSNWEKLNVITPLWNLGLQRFLDMLMKTCDRPLCRCHWKVSSTTKNKLEEQI